jgi:pilus assembly protein CpaC
MTTLLRKLGLIAAAMLAAGSLSISSASPNAAAASADGTALQAGLQPLQRDLTVTINQSTPVSVARPFKRIAVSQPEIADASPTSNNRLYVRGRMIGSTNILVYDADGQLVEIIDVRVQHDIGAITADVAALFPNTHISMRTVAQRLHVRGFVPDDETAAEIIQIAASYAPEAVIDALKLNRSQQVMLEVRFVEASREDIQEIGIGNEISRAGDFLFSTSANLLSGGGANSIATILGASGGVNIDLFIQALEEKGIIHTLAEPNLVARSGETASFLAGGEFPVPVAADEDTVTIEFREFGVSLEFTPTILADNKISLEVSPEVSQLDPRNSVILSNVEIPALSVRRANTTVELEDGQSFAIAGLIQNTVDSTSVQTPFLADVPILGALFRSNRFRENETELVIIITPRLATPAPVGTQLPDPLTNRGTPSDVERLLLGKLETNEASAPQPANATLVSDAADAGQMRRSDSYGHEAGVR